MALTVGQLNAVLTLDDSGFNRGVDQAGGKFGRLKDNVVAGARMMAGATTTVATVLGGLAASTVKTGASYNILQQNSRAALRTLVGGAEAANAQMDKLDAFAKQSPFAKQVFITAQQQLLGFGVAADKVIPALDAIQNAVAAMGQSGEAVGAITEALAEMKSAGKLSGETLARLAGYGIDAATIVGEQLGKTGDQIRKLASKPGGIPVDQVWDPLVTGLMERFGGATAQIKEQMSGAVDRVKGATRDIGSALVKPFIDPNGGGMAVAWVNQFADTLRAAEEKAKPFVDLLVTRFAPSLGKVTPALERARQAINSWDLSKLNDQMDRMKKYVPYVSALTAAWVSFGSGTIPIIGKFLPAINPAVAAMLAFAATSPEIRTVGNAIEDALRPLIPMAKELGIQFVDVANEAVGALAPALIALIQAATPLVPLAMELGEGLVEVAGDVVGELAPAFIQLVQSVGPVAVGMAESLVPAMKATAEVAVPIASAVADIIRWISGLPGPVLAAVAAFLVFKRINQEGMLKPLKDGWKSLTETVSASRTVLQETGRSAGVMNTAMMTAKVGVQGLGAAMKAALMSNAVGLALTAITTAFSIFSGQAAEAKARVEMFADAFDEAGNTITGAADKIVKHSLVTGEGITWGGWEKWDAGASSAAEGLLEMGFSLDEVSAATVGTQEDFDALIAAIREVGEGSREFYGTAGQVITKLGHLRDANAESARQAELLADNTEESADASSKATEAINGEVDALRKKADAQREAGANAMSQREAEINLTKTKESLAAAIENGAQVQRDENGAILSNTEATIKADEWLIGYSRNMESYIDTLRRNNLSSAELNKTLAAQREEFISSATQMGYSGEEAAALADQYGLIPDRVVTDVVARTENAEGGITRIQKSIDTLTGQEWTTEIATNANGVETTITKIIEKLDALTGKTWTTKVVIDAPTGNFTVSGPNGTMRGSMATGGPVTGPGTGTSDDVPAMLSNGEHVWTASEVTRAGGHGAVGRMRAAARQGLLPAFATGGAVVSDAAQQRFVDAQSALAAAKATVATLEARKAADTEYWEDREQSDETRRTLKARDKELDRAKEQLAAAEEVANREQRISDARTKLMTEDRRGTFIAGATGSISGAMSAIDRMLELAGSEDLDGQARSDVAWAAGNAERQLREQYRLLEGITEHLEEQIKLREEMANLQDRVRDSLVNELKLTDAITKTEEQVIRHKNDKGEITYETIAAGESVTAAGIRNLVESKVAAVKDFANKLDQLRQRGLHPALLQEIQAAGTQTGSKMADALLAGSWDDMSAINQGYDELTRYATQAGNTIVLSQYGIGVAMMDGLVGGLKSQKQAALDAITDVATAMQTVMKNALGIHSPSKVFARLGAFAGEGVVVGMRSRRAEIARAARQLVAIPRATIGPEARASFAAETRSTIPTPTRVENHLHYNVAEVRKVSTADELRQALAAGGTLWDQGR